MNKLMKASQWSEREFEVNSTPDNRTIKRWINDGLLKGKILQGSVWVFSSEKWNRDPETLSY